MVIASEKHKKKADLRKVRLMILHCCVIQATDEPYIRVSDGRGGERAVQRWIRNEEVYIRRWTWEMLPLDRLSRKDQKILYEFAFTELMLLRFLYRNRETTNDIIITIGFRINSQTCGNFSMSGDLYKLIENKRRLLHNFRADKSFLTLLGMTLLLRPDLEGLEDRWTINDIKIQVVTALLQWREDRNISSRPMLRILSAVRSDTLKVPMIGWLLDCFIRGG